MSFRSWSIYTPFCNPAKLDEELAAVARAANTIGIRIAVAVAMRDVNPLGYGPDNLILDGLDASDRELIQSKLLKAPASPVEQVRFVDNLAGQIEGPRSRSNSGRTEWSGVERNFCGGSLNGPRKPVGASTCIFSN